MEGHRNAWGQEWLIWCGQCPNLQGSQMQYASWRLLQRGLSSRLHQESGLSAQLSAPPPLIFPSWPCHHGKNILEKVHRGLYPKANMTKNIAWYVDQNSTPCGVRSVMQHASETWAPTTRSRLVKYCKIYAPLDVKYKAYQRWQQPRTGWMS